MSLQIATVKENEKERRCDTSERVTDVQATKAYYPEAAATACSCQTFQLLARQHDDPSASKLACAVCHVSLIQEVLDVFDVDVLIK